MNYEELVNALRKVADYINCYDCDMWGLGECDTERKSCVLHNAAAAIEELQQIASPWHRVEVEEPTKAGWYLVMDVDGDFNVDEWHNTFGWQFVTPSDADRITHWMSIEPPQEVQDDTCKRPD